MGCFFSEEKHSTTERTKWRLLKTNEPKKNGKQNRDAKIPKEQKIQKKKKK